MSGRRILRRFSSSISDLLSIQRKCTTDETENGTALHTAVQMGNVVMTQNLLECKSVWIDEEDGKGRTALHYAVEHNSNDLVELLLKFSANPDCVDFNGTSACHLACQDGLIDIFRLLEEYNADIYAIDKSGKTPFDLACEYGQDKMVQFLLSSCVELHTLKKSGSTHTASASHLAARNGHTHILLRLFESGWEINRTTSMGSALHEAAGNGKGQVVRFLLHAGIDSTLTNSSGHTALDVAKKNAQKNPITIKEVKFLLKEHKKFIYGQAIREHRGVRADELSFSEGDLIWIIDRNCKDGRDKGVIFGQKANSRSGLFDPSAVRVVERPQSVIGSMTSRISTVPMQTFGQPAVCDRKVKKCEIPIVPKVNIVKPSRNSMFDSCRSQAGSYRNLISPTRDDCMHSSRNLGPLNTFGTDARLSYGKGGMTSVQSSSSSTISGIELHRQSTASNCSQSSSGFESMKNGTSSPSSSSLRTSQQSGECRTSLHSSGSGSGSGPSSLASCSVDTLDDSFTSASSFEPSLDVTQMVARGIPEAEILAIWLDKMNMSEYLSLFLKQGYDLSTIARITPEDLLNVGVANPDHRRLLMAEIHSWNITDSWPSYAPVGGLKEWLEALSLPEYFDTFVAQRCNTVQDVLTLAWEDLEDIGIKRLGHLKRLLLAAKKLRDCRNCSVDCNVPMKRNGSVPVAVHSPRIQARPLEPLRNDVISPRPCDPPPPAPSGSYKGKPLVNGIDYFSYSRGSRNAPITSRADEIPTTSRQQFDSSDSTDRRREPLRLNFYGNGQILSEARERGDTFSIAGSTTNLDFPPAPAPLVIDSSIRRLQDACASSASLGSASSASSLEIPFANENCGTIRTRDSKPTSDEMNVPTVVFSSGAAPRPSILKNSAPKENVLSSIDKMFESLTAELDDMIEPFKRKA